MRRNEGYTRLHTNLFIFIRVDKKISHVPVFDKSISLKFQTLVTFTTEYSSFHNRVIRHTSAEKNRPATVQLGEQWEQPVPLESNGSYKLFVDTEGVPVFLPTGWILLLDNALQLTVQQTLNAVIFSSGNFEISLTQFGFTPGDFYLFPSLKEHLSSHHCT